MGFVVDPNLSAPAAAQPDPSEQEPMLYCPVCSQRLSERKCKLLCDAAATTCPAPTTTDS